MNPLFAEVLAKKDLSKAGELFNLSDSVVVKDLDDIVDEIIAIADTEDYESNDNDQSVVEISITRITTAMREAEDIEKLAVPLVRLLNMCHKHNMTQASKDEDPPHAKIASDIMSRLFTYYSNNAVMSLAIPAIVNFLDCDNKDLVRSVASYLTLATIDNASLLAKHMSQVLSSVLKGNYLLGQVIPQIYEQNPEPVVEHVDELAQLMQKCDATEKVCFLQLFTKMAKTHPELLEKHVPQLCNYLTSSTLSTMVLMTLVDLALARPESVQGQLSQVQAVVDTQPMLMYQVAQITAAVGTISQEDAKKAMEYLISKTTSIDQTILPAVLQEIRGLGLEYPSLLAENVDRISRLSASPSSTVRLAVQQIKEDVRKNNKSNRASQPPSANQSRVSSPSPTDGGKQQKVSTSSSTLDAPPEQPPKVRQMRSVSSQTEGCVSSQTEGTVTIITVGNPPNATHPSGTVSVKSTGVHPSGESGTSSQQSLAKVSRASAAETNHTTGYPHEGDHHASIGVGTSHDPTYRNESVRDGVQLFCEKHFTKIKNFISKLNATIPLPVRCSVVNGKHKRYLKLHFECGHQLSQCLYSGSHFTLNTRLPKLWVHLMFLAVQAQAQHALSQRDADVSCLKDCWDALKAEANSSFLALVTSSFPTQKDQLSLLQELHQMRYFDVFELNAARGHWACFVCNHPEKISELLNDGCPEIAGQLKEKKGKWKFFKRWKTRYFTLSGGSITYDKSNSTKASLPVTKIQSVKAVRRGIRDIPKAFEIFTGDQTYTFKAKDRHNVEQWVQCLHIAVARSQHPGGSETASILGAKHSSHGHNESSQQADSTSGDINTLEATTSADTSGVGASDYLVAASPTPAATSRAIGGGRPIRHRHSASAGHSRPGAYAALFDPQPTRTSTENGKVVTDTKL